MTDKEIQAEITRIATALILLSNASSADIVIELPRIIAQLNAVRMVAGNVVELRPGEMRIA